jgi:hypothetical protein
MKTNEENFAVLKDVRGRDVALKGVNVRARLHGLMADVEVEQIYRNPQKTNIEAIYTFPLPLGAVLLALEVEIGGKKLSGSVVEKKQAERDYEDAVTDGNSAVMLEEAGPGLYTASLGNLMAGESAVIRYRYGLLLSWQGPAPALPAAHHHRPPLWRCRRRRSAAASGAHLFAGGRLPVGSVGDGRGRTRGRNHCEPQPPHRGEPIGQRGRRAPDRDADARS